ncbi:hypothetical protein TESG_02099 [Trichophyton tonsurans CBS 112818]|uniref:F-box domain-containing protein n=1 Tax=Trichophyton tonsurans (strain CBS 112818) TaxID=647933 RepID=F2RTE0_TRIT1|nr:hypothetical protein TESG_02099 [Trichophyton tonsurans CBS 112818]
MDTSLACPRQEKLLTLTSLPAEIQETILSQLDSFRTLNSIAATCRAFRDLVLYHPRGIIDRILKSIIPDEVFPEAITFFEASKLPTTNVEVVQELLGRYFTSLKRNMGPRPKFSLSEATTLEKYHRLIQGFTHVFITSALSKHPITGDEVKPPWFVTKGEQYRIQRALYRFELYWKLFKRMERNDRSQRYPQLAIPLQDHSKLYFDHFAPWENEQMICIQDFLLRIVDEVFNDVAAHDVEWGEWGIEYNEGYKKFEHRREMLNPHRNVQLASIDRALKQHRSPYIDRIPLSRYSGDRLKHDIQKPTVWDGRGPAEVWRTTHLEMSSYNFVMADEHISLRERGYVMWDYSRLSNWGLLRVPWQPPPREPPEVELDMREKVFRSHQRRSDIYLQGGRGWWSEEDESRVVYPRQRASRKFTPFQR